MSLRNLTKWEGKPTSGRYVYKTNGWFWQCDLHETRVVYSSLFYTMQEAFSDALYHANECPHRNLLTRKDQS